MTGALYYGDNLDVLREHVAEASVDLIYLDPPFNSNATYNVLFRAPAGRQSEAQIEAFQDTWHWGESAARAFDDVIRSRHVATATLLRAMRSFLGESDVMAYLAMMAVRLIELHRVLKPTGSLYLHCDPTASHYLKLLLDGVFGPLQFRNEIIWLRSRNPKGSQFLSRRWGPSTDTLLYYAQTDAAALNLTAAKRRLPTDELERMYPNEDSHGRWADGPILRSTSMGARPKLVYSYEGFTPGPSGWRVELAELKEIDRRGDLYWTSEGRPRRKWRAEPDAMAPVGNCWTDIPPINSQARERLGYPTQKPLALLERIIAASSNPGDVVLDPFCGCGTAVHAAQKLGRSWVGIDITHLAISLIERRLKDAFPDIRFDVHGTPRDLDGARDLARRDKYQFQWWAVSLVDAVPQGGKRKGADRGIDGVRWVRTGPKEADLEQVLVSVKGGEGVGVAMIRDLKGTVEREHAAAGLFITLAEPTREMRREAAASGFFESGFGRHPKLQILSIAELLAGMRPDLPPLGRGEGFRRAPRERGSRPEQGGLDI